VIVSVKQLSLKKESDITLISKKEHLRVPFFLHKIFYMVFFSKKEKNDATAHSLFDWVDSLVCASVLCILFFTFSFKTMRVIGSSMYPTYHDGQRVIAITPFTDLHRGDVIITDDNNGTGDPLIKRIIAFENETVVIDPSGKILIDGEILEDYVDAGLYTTYGDTEYPIVVPEGMVFLMGDNREVSYDSRYTAVGCISSDCIVGRVIS